MAYCKVIDPVMRGITERNGLSRYPAVPAVISAKQC